MNKLDLAKALNRLPPDKAAAARARIKWLASARPKQIPPRHKKWFAWMALAGRGFGKSRAVSEDTWWNAAWNDNTRWAVVAATANDLRRTCFEGDSGLLNVVPIECLLGGSVDTAYNRSLFELKFANGSLIQGFSADAFDRLRGPQFHGALIDELCAWSRDRDAWNMLMMTLRLGDDPRVVIATTPKPTTLLKELVKRDDIVIVNGSTYENKANLAQPFLEMLERTYSGTRIGQQELEAKILDTPEGALWTWELIEKARYMGVRPEFTYITVNIDPSVGDGNPNNDECGIIATGLGRDGYGYVLGDSTLSASPNEWVQKAIDLYHQINANWIVAEANNGGKLIESAIHATDSSIPVRLVHASQGKRTRAEPVAMLYEQGRIRHFGVYPDLENELCDWSPERSQYSPARVDSLTWGFTSLMVEKPSEFFCFVA